MITLAEKTIDVARTKLGIKEATGHNDGAFIYKIQMWLGKWMDRQPWCAVFATWCVWEAWRILGGPKPKMIKSASSSQLYRWARDTGNLLDGPEGYCIGLMKGGPTGYKHTFLVNAFGGNYLKGQTWVWGIDGNWKNAVSRTQHAVKDCVFIRIV
jgi:hypothetical protein